MEKNILLAGFGGQGILFLGKVIAYAGLIANYEVSWLPSYGPEMRGGTANCSVCISKEPIASPLILHPDVLVALNYPSAEKFIGKVKIGGTVFIDNSIITEELPFNDINLHSIPATQLANEYDLKNLANMIVLGNIIGKTEMFNDDIMKQAIIKSIPSSKEELKELNLKAYEIGKNFI